LEGVGRVGITAGASTPDWLIKQVVQRLNEIGEPQKAHQ
jgi:4-hydroxy-3-methylbut-2-enyl diphosphate reductase